MSIDRTRLLDLKKRGSVVPSVEDQILWRSFKKGNDVAFSVLYNKYVQPLYNFGMHTCYNRDIVMDCLQELFSRLWAKREHLAEVQAVNFYLFKSFRRLLLNRLEQKRRFFLPLPDFDDRRFEITPSFEDVVILEQTTTIQHKRLERAVAGLTKRQREAIFLKFFNELSYAEVAEIMELRIDSIYNLITKAINSLRKELKSSLFYFLLSLLP